MIHPSLWVFAAAVLMATFETARPVRRWPKVPGWLLRAIPLNLVQVGSVWLAGVLWDPWLLRHRPWSAAGLGVLGGATVGYLAHTFLFYWWHRWRHEVPLLWRLFHQVHHSPQRIEVITSFYKHPLEILVNGLLFSGMVYGVVGISPQAGALAALFCGLAELFYHWNVRTPRWLGWLIQRPESHCVHHEEGVHRWNYGDLPLWDFLFGTLRNPETWEARCGFGPEPEQRLGEMLRGVDIRGEQ